MPASVPAVSGSRPRRSRPHRLATSPSRRRGSRRRASPAPSASRNAPASKRTMPGAAGRPKVPEAASYQRRRPREVEHAGRGRGRQPSFSSAAAIVAVGPAELQERAVLWIERRGAETPMNRALRRSNGPRTSTRRAVGKEGGVLLLAREEGAERHAGRSRVGIVPPVQRNVSVTFSVPVPPSSPVARTCSRPDAVARGPVRRRHRRAVHVHVAEQRGAVGEVERRRLRNGPLPPCRRARSPARGVSAARRPQLEDPGAPTLTHAVVFERREIVAARSRPTSRSSRCS